MYTVAQEGGHWLIADLVHLRCVGSPAVMIGVGAITAGGIVIDEMHMTSGARFGSAFNWRDVVRSRWESFGLMSSCEQGVQIESNLADFGAGSQVVVPLHASPDLAVS